MEPNVNDEIEIDLRELFFVLMRKWWLILLCGLLLATATGLFSKLVITPIYKSTTKLYVVSKSTSITSLTDLQLGSQLTQDYMVLVNSRPVVEQVIENLNMDTTYEKMLNIITVTNPPETRILELAVEDDDPVIAKEIVDELAKVFATQMAKVMDVQEPNIVETGNLATVPASPHILKNTLIGGILGLFISAIIILGIYIMNDTIQTSEDVEKYLAINMLGMLPLEETIADKNKKKKKLKDRRRS